MKNLSPEQIVVDLVRFYLGKGPLYAKAADAEREAHGTYPSRERLSRLASPDCKRCSGSGYYDGWETDERCPCTGLPPKGKRGSGAHPDTQRDMFRPRHAQRSAQE